MKTGKPFRNAQYMGLAFQFLAAILLGVFSGKWLDGFHDWSAPVFSILVPVLLVIGVLIKIVQDVSGKK